MSTWHYFNVKQNMHLIVLLDVLCVRWYDVRWAAAEPLLGCCVLCQTETQTPAVQWPVDRHCAAQLAVVQSFLWQINVHLPKCLNRHHNANGNVLSITYCVLCIVYCTHPLLQFLRRLKTTFIPQCGARPLCSILCYLTP